MYTIIMYRFNHPTRTRTLSRLPDVSLPMTCVCIRVYIYIYIHTYIHTYIHINHDTCIYIYIYTHIIILEYTIIWQRVRCMISYTIT